MNKMKTATTAEIANEKVSPNQCRDDFSFVPPDATDPGAELSPAGLPTGIAGLDAPDVF